MSEEGLIYCWTNQINGKQYVGQTNDFDRRVNQHIGCALSGCKDCNSLLHKAIRSYGEDNFEVEILEAGLDLEVLNDLESFYIETLRTLSPLGYNLICGEMGIETPSSEHHLQIIDYLPPEDTSVYELEALLRKAEVSQRLPHE